MVPTSHKQNISAPEILSLWGRGGDCACNHFTQLSQKRELRESYLANWSVKIMFLESELRSDYVSAKRSLTHIKMNVSRSCGEKFDTVMV